MTWLFSIFLVSLGTAIVPTFNSELYLVGVMSTHPELHWWLTGPIAATRQLLGKATHYLAARGVLELPGLLERPVRPRRRWLRWYDRFRRECRERPIWSTGVVLSSGVLGVPPFAVIVIAAGFARLPLVILVPASVAGRLVRFCAIAASPTLIHTVRA